MAAFTHWHVIFYWHFGTAARGKGMRVGVVMAGDANPTNVAFDFLKAHVPNANLMVDPAKTVCDEKSSGNHKPVDLPDVYFIGKVPMDSSTGGDDGVASWSRRNAYMSLEPKANKKRNA